MRHLIELFLNKTKNPSAEFCEGNFSLDEAAIQCYAQATAEIQKRQRHQTNLNPAATEQTLRKTLAAISTNALCDVDLRDFSAYCTFTKTVQRWRPRQKKAQQAGQYIRQILLELLPAIRKKQQLETLCRDYKNHLTKTIETGLKSEYPDIYRQYQQAEPRMFGAPPDEDGQPCLHKVPTTFQRIDRLVTEKAAQMKKSSPELEAAIQKYQAVATLEATLQVPIYSVKTQLTHFSREFETQQTVIAKDRDSLAIKFVKGLATILSLGFAGLLGIWGVRGKTAANDMTQVLSTAAGVKTQA
jgi:hypothetical protein